MRARALVHNESAFGPCGVRIRERGALVISGRAQRAQLESSSSANTLVWLESAVALAICASAPWPLPKTQA